ncbi:amino-acid N-acetyltransferase [Entomortierella parvispora]|uniref:Amino-acid acetyltransferase, mitochondrial n=1 Tax=Entomortierella parvispora TaxID=205924 RepID=A0A9P3M0W1_9FUNG|nr:amino-acid N-acetyltransferase [Entomortierella parvispora]
MWRSLLPRHAHKSACPVSEPFATATTATSPARRCYSLRSQKIQAVVHEHKRAKEQDRDLILKVMGTLPSPREARQFLSRFSTPDPARAVDSSSSSSSPSSSKSKGSETQRSTGASQFVDTLLWPTDHLALIKLEGPFDAKNLASIATTLVQLQKLGLMSIVMLDNQGWWQNQSPALLGPVESEMERQLAETRQRMMKDMAEMVEEIEKFGGRARPIYEGVFEEDETAPAAVVDHMSKTGARGPLELKKLLSSISEDGSDDEIRIKPGLLPVESCLKLRQIPVLIPMATTACCHRVPLQSNKALVALAKYMGKSTAEAVEGINNGEGMGSRGLVPMRLIVVNTTGGIPLTRSYGIDGPTHCFVNLKDEYGAILEDLENMDHITSAVATSYRSDLDMIKESLEHLPPTCSALITSSPSLTLITNLITDKPLFSSTMRGQDPKVMLATTVLRNGLDMFAFRGSLAGLDLSRLQVLLESSFGKPLDGDGYYARIKDRTRTVILAGQDYMGAAIVTQEGGGIPHAKGDPSSSEKAPLATVAYLDKFSVAPKSQGIGVADILWKKLTDEFPDLVWRSRSNNPVNKWYFDRADGNIRIPGTNWTVFWYGPKGLSLIRDYIEICRDIPASFTTPKATKS